MALTNAQRQKLWRIRTALSQMDFRFDYASSLVDELLYLRYLDLALEYHLLISASDDQLHLL